MYAIGWFLESVSAVVDRFPEAEVGSFWQWLLLSALAYAMFAVAYVFESRLPFRDVPVWRLQSKAFLPGDLSFAFCIALSTPSWPTLRLGVIGLVVAVGVVTFLRVTAKKDYGRARMSPSKLYHDYIVSSVFAFLLVIGWWPVLSGDENLAGWWIAAAAIGMGIWLVGMVWDITTKTVPNPQQHPDDWRPIWRKPSASFI